MGKASKILKGDRRKVLYLVAACLLALGAGLVGIGVFAPENEPVREVAAPESAFAPEPLVNEALVEARSRAAGEEARQKAAEEARQEAAQEERAAEEPAEREVAQREAPTAIPTDTAMYLTIPAIGLHDVLVLDGTSEAVLSQGAGHVPGTGFPWIEGSNTYLAAHRLGYPGTGSDHVFYDLPALAIGDEVFLTDSLGQQYTYRVSEVLEVSPYDLSVTGPVPGRDIVSLQTCIENYGDYWTPGPNWLARYVVRADRVE
jgi:sortase A